MTVIDLNADLGEGFGRWVLGDDEAMLDELAGDLPTAEPSALDQLAAEEPDRVHVCADRDDVGDDCCCIAAAVIPAEGLE